MDPLIISYSGIRGIVGASLTDAVVERFAQAFGRLVTERYPRPTILLARDTRPSGDGFFRAACNGLAPFGELVDLGVVPTPTLQVAMKAFSAQGGLCITASHNPSAWNGMKFFLGPDNIVLDGEQTRALCALANEAPVPPSMRPSITERHDEAVRAHLERVLAEVDAHRRLRVALDSGGGAGAEPTRELLERLGCEVVTVSSQRESEPIPEHLGDLCRVVVEEGCDLGMAQDLDADRLALVTERGEAPGEEQTLVLVVQHLLQRFQSVACTVVKNVATTRAVDDVARAHGATLLETAVGEVNLSRTLLEQRRQGRIAFGGEGNGGVIFPPVALGRDSLIAAALVLEHLGSGETLTQRLAALPRYHMRKLARPHTRPFEEIVERAAALFPDARCDRSDGLKVELADAWFALRLSNTEPVVRIVAESRAPEWPTEIVNRLSALL